MLKPVLGVSPPFLNGFSYEYLDPRLRVGVRGGSGSALRPADCGPLELAEGEGTGISLYICVNDGLHDNNSSLAAIVSLLGFVG